MSATPVMGPLVSGERMTSRKGARYSSGSTLAQSALPRQEMGQSACAVQQGMCTQGPTTQASTHAPRHWNTRRRSSLKSSSSGSSLGSSSCALCDIRRQQGKSQLMSVLPSRRGGDQHQKCCPALCPEHGLETQQLKVTVPRLIKYTLRPEGERTSDTMSRSSLGTSQDASARTCDIECIVHCL